MARPGAEAVQEGHRAHARPVQPAQWTLPPWPLVARTETRAVWQLSRHPWASRHCRVGFGRPRGGTVVCNLGVASQHGNKGEGSGGALGAVGALGWRQAALELIPIPMQNFLLVLCGSGFHLARPGPWQGTMAAATTAAPCTKAEGSPPLLKPGWRPLAGRPRPASAQASPSSRSFV